MIIDAHCQLGASRTLDMALAPDELRAALDESGIDRACCFSVPDLIDNDAVLAASAADDRLIPIACVDPTRADAVDELERCLRAGMRGVRLHPYLHGFKLSMPIVDPLFALCARYRALVLCHGADDVPANNPYQFVIMADRHPAVPLIALYGGFVWNVGDMTHAAATRDNLYLEIAAWAPGTLRGALADLAADKFIFGSALPDGDQLVGLRRVHAALPEDAAARDAILGGTMRRLLSL